MILKFKQRFLSIFDSYDIYDGNNNVYYTVKGKFSIGHKFLIYNTKNEEIGMLKQNLFTFLPKYSIYINNEKQGEIHKNFTLLKPKFTITFGNYTVDGNFLEWDYKVYKNDSIIATISKELFHLTDTYLIDVNEEDALIVLMIVLAIDSIKDQHNAND